MVHEVFKCYHSFYIYVDDIRKYNYNINTEITYNPRGYIWLLGKLAFSKKISDKSLYYILNHRKELKIEGHGFVSFSSVDPEKQFSTNKKFDAWVKQLYKKT